MNCGCGCLGVLIAMLTPRVAMVAIFFFRNEWLRQAYDKAVWPILGFLFMPYTTLAYMAAMVNAGEIKDGWLVLVIAAVVIDLGSWFGGGETARRRRG